MSDRGSPKRTLWVCESYQLEAMAVLEEIDPEGTRSKPLPITCVRGRGARGRPHDEPPGTAPGSVCRLVCDSGGGLDAESSEVVHQVRVHRCFDLVADPGLVDELTASGAYLLTPGWLQRWPEHVKGWGLDRGLAREFFAESCSQLVLLDTGTCPDSEQRLQELASFVDRPAERRSVGLDRYRSFLTQTLAEWRLEERARSAEAALIEAQRRAADHAMAADLTAGLAQATTESEAIDKILELFSLLFSPEQLLYVALRQGHPSDVRTWPASERTSEQTIRPLLRLAGDHEIFDQGLKLRIRRGAETLGLLEATGFEDPANLERYVNVGLNSTGACALAIANARLYEELQANIRSLDAFSHTVAHDLKAPLTSILGFAGLALASLDKMTTDQLRKDLERIDRLGRKMQSIIEALLLLAAVRQAEVDVERLDMGFIVAEAMSRFESEIEEAGARIDLPDSWPRPLGHGPWVEEVWANLIGNALKYGGEPPQIVLGHEQENDGRLRFWIRDNGRGIALEDQPRLFVPFSRLGRIPAQGQGLGLAIVRQIVERLGGEVAVRSRDGEGSTFSFTLPSVRHLEEPAERP